jgi:hypothetical protein
LQDSILINGGNKYYREYAMTRYINCINIKYGELENFRKRWILEWFAGISIRYFHSFTDLPKQEYNGIVHKEELRNTSMTGSQVREIGNHVYPNLTCGFKVGYRLL